MNNVLLGLGKLMKPFSKVSNAPVLPKEDFKWAKLLEDNCDAIKNELSALLQHDDHLLNIEDIWMRVANEIINWKSGKAVFFDDTYNHEVWNETENLRVVLLIDTVRPYKSWGAKINNQIIKGITESVYVKQAKKKRRLGKGLL